jgi:cyclopropane fatty-acyl-phospholipid synthase-like methyltransferase
MHACVFVCVSMPCVCVRARCAPQPYVRPSMACGELGSGGGRVARCLAPVVASLACMDVSAGMLRRCQDRLAADGLADRVTYHLLVEDTGSGTPPRLPAVLRGALDFVVAFDVFVHLDLHTQWWYWQELRDVLVPGGHAFVSTANLLAPGVCVFVEMCVCVYRFGVNRCGEGA